MTAANKSALKVFSALEILCQNFADGMAPSELAKATGVSAPQTTRIIATLEATGFAERIPETGRVRPSIHFARLALAVLKSLDSAQTRLAEVATRVNKTL